MTEEEMNRKSSMLALNHWRYIEELLEAHGTDVEHISIAEFHYLEAFKHGYKHCWEDLYSENTGKIVVIDPKEFKK